MKNFIKGLLMFMGVLFFIQVIALAYFWFADPLDIKQYFVVSKHVISSNTSADATDNNNPSSATTNQTPTTTTNTTAPTSDNSNPFLDPDQEVMLANIGVDIDSLPTEIDKDLEICLIDSVGQKRADEIVNGDVPNVIDFMKARDCL